MRPRHKRGGFLKAASTLAAGAALCGVVALAAWSLSGLRDAPPEWAPVTEPPTANSADPQTATGGPFGPRPGAADLRKRYPYESLAGRLEYEGDGAGAEPDLPPATLQRLNAVEQGFQDREMLNRRVKSLAKLHSDQVEQFVNEEGFGVSRMMPMTSPSYLELPAAPPIPFAHAADLPPGREGAPAELPATGGTGGAARVPSREMLGWFHDFGRFDFLNPSAFGHVKDREHVAGFMAHHFRQMPELRDPRAKAAPETERWALRRLELVSLLKHGRPAVYVSDHLPRMDDLKKSQTRPLSEFEGRALRAVRDGEDLVAEATTNRIEMMGSLRATKQCLDCHHAHRGDLLGAFSYELQRDPAPGK
jgi:hypothetical protein